MPSIGSGELSPRLARAIKVLCGAEAQVDAEGTPGAPDAAGVYAWWSSEPSLLGVAGTEHKSGYLYYVGIASHRSGLRRRLTTHANKRARQSTLRLTLAALGAIDARPALDKRGKLRLGEEDEAALSHWIATHLKVSWYEVTQPHDLEAAVIARLAPPLNLDFSGRHPAFSHVKSARRVLRDRAAAMP
jgi:hypothetical protein